MVLTDNRAASLGTRYTKEPATQSAQATRRHEGTDADTKPNAGERESA